MTEEPFVDYYEILQVSPNVDTGTIERVFRHLAKRYHPDNSQSGNADTFDVLVKAYRILTNEEQRASFDLLYHRQRKSQTVLVAEASDTDDLEADRVLREKLLSLLYVKRRRDLRNPGLGNMELERLLDRPSAILDFHLWYMREKGWIERTENGYLAITANGVEQFESSLRGLKFRMIEDQGRSAKPGATE